LVSGADSNGRKREKERKREGKKEERGEIEFRERFSCSVRGRQKATPKKANKFDLHNCGTPIMKVAFCYG